MSGLYFEEFEVGQVFDHAIRRTVTELQRRAAMAVRFLWGRTLVAWRHLCVCS